MYYKSESFVKSTVNELNISMVKAKMSIEESEKKLENMGIKLYRQFRNFVMSNRTLFDDDFIVKLSVRTFSVTQVVMINSKAAVRLRVEPKNTKSMFVMVPLLFISDVSAYASVRKRKVSFGAGATDEHIKKHYDGEIDKLQKEIDALRTERTEMSPNNEDWS